MKSLFGRKKAEPKENPYAQQERAQEQYDRMSPYQRARADVAGNAPRPNIPGGLPSGPGPRRDYGGSPAPSTQTFDSSTDTGSSQGYASSKYGSGAGYGMNQFDSNSTAFSDNQNTPPLRMGGYGGLGGRPVDSPDKNELFSGARQSEGPNRYGPRVPQPGEAPNRYAAAGPPPQAPEEENDYVDEDLTQEQLEKRQFRKIRKEQDETRDEGLATLGRTLAIMDQAVETGTRTLANLGAQEERLNRVEQNLNRSKVHARNAQAKTSELQTLNRSMFAVHVENPFTKKKRMMAQEQAILDQSREDRNEMEAVRGEGYRRQQYMEKVFDRIDEKRSKASKWAEVDEEDIPVGNDHSDEEENRTAKAKEKAHGEGVESLGRGVMLLNSIAREHGRMIENSNGTIDRISAKTDGVTDHVVKNSAKLRTFK